MPTLKPRWYYKYPGSFHANGPTTERFEFEEQARNYLRDLHERTGDDWPEDTELWPTSL